MDRALKRYLARRLLSRPLRWYAKFAQARDVKHGRVPVDIPLLNGMRILVDPRQTMPRRIYRFGAHEFGYIYLLYGLGEALGRLDVVLDIGANMGNHSLLFSDCFGKVHAIEPHPDLCDLIEQSIEVNRIDNVSLHQCGLSDEDGVANFVVPRGNHLDLGCLDTTLSPSQLEKSENTFDVKVRTGDSLLENETGRIDCIKLDVEGHELEALRGLKATIERDRPYMLIEYLPDKMERGGGWDAFTSLLPEYRFFDPMFPDRSGFVSRIACQFGTYRIQLTPVTSAPAKFSKLIAIPEECLAQVLESRSFGMRNGNS